MEVPNKDDLERLGFSFEVGSSLTKRTIMTAELGRLLEYVPGEDATPSEYSDAAIDRNCLAKRTAKNRSYTFSYLKRLYSLDQSDVLFRAFRFFYLRDPNSRPVLCLLMAYARDSILRSSAGYVLNLPKGHSLVKSDFEAFMDRAFPDRFGPKMLASLVRNLSSSWSQSGHLEGRRSKSRVAAPSGPGAAAFAVYCGYLNGVRGSNLFRSDYAAMLDGSFEGVAEMTDSASRKGWLVFRRISDVIDIDFPNLIDPSHLLDGREEHLSE